MRWPAAALALLCLAAAAGAEDKLEGLQQAIDARRAHLAEYERDARGLLDTLETLDKTTHEATRAAREAERRAEAARGALRDLDARAAALDARRARSRAALSARAVALYKTGELGPVRLLFSSRDLRELLVRTRTLRTLIEHDRSLLEEARQAQRDLDRLRAERREASAVQERAARSLTARRRALAEEAEARRSLLARVRGDRTRERQALVELERAAQTLKETLVGLNDNPATRRQEGAGFAARAGSLPRPVDAPITRAFGRVVDAEFRTETLRKGVDFAAPAGDPVRAVAPGEVRFAGWFRGYGKLVILDHGDDYFSVSGHLAELAVEAGEPVRAGDAIGSVGETGSLSGPMLYFELRHGAEPLDPGRWLAEP